MNGMRSSHARWYVALVLAAAALAISALAADDKYVQLVHSETGKVLGVADDSSDSEARAVLAKDEKNTARHWKLVKDGNYLKIVNRRSEKVLDVSGESTDEEAPIIIWDDKSEGNDNQRWSWVGEGKARRLQSKSSSLVLDVDGEGKLVQRKENAQRKSQLWIVAEVKE